MKGLLSRLNDPAFMARIDERVRLAERLAVQMGVSAQEARQALEHFETDVSTDGQIFH